MLLVATGCQPAVEEAPKEKPPRPVEVATLTLQAQQNQQITAASAASWKSENIGFEVSGRIEWVAEPNTNIEGRVVNAKGDVVIAGDPIARIESETYRLQVEKAQAELSKSKQSVTATQTELNESFPAQLRAAKADLKNAELDRDRRVRLVQRNAGAQADVDKAEAVYQNALSKIDQLNSGQKAKESELASLKLQVEIAQQALSEAQRSLGNCVLYSSFRGQIADVSVVPGSFVGAGNPVATVQMMNPIKVEFEVSAEESRRLRDRQNVSVILSLDNGAVETIDGHIYLIDSIADPQTRTFTVTVLVKNNNVAPDQTADSKIPSVDQVWPTKYDFLPGADQSMDFLAEDAILQDDLGHFVWKVENMQIGDEIPTDRILNVTKLRVQKGELQLPFLGNWLFHQVTFHDDSIDFDKTLVAGKMSLPAKDANAWDGNQVRIDTKRSWKLRPGDVIQIDLSVKRENSGLFVPMNAIVHQGDQTFIVLVSNEQDGIAKTSRKEVRLLPRGKDQSSSSVREIEAVGDQDIVGQKYVTAGAHFLVEGQQVRIVDSQAAASRSATESSE
jgi:multidrug resistance efflux pump